MSGSRKPPKAPVNPDDARLFRDAVGPVRPLPDPPEAPARPRPKPRPRQRDRDEAEALADLRMRPFDASLADPGEPLAYRRPEFPERLFKRLRRGEFAVEDELDLHHLRVAEAETLLREFLAEAQRAGHHCVQVIHGKGRNSEHRTPVLKLLVDRILAQRSDVLAYASAPPRQGGTGAVLVLLGDPRGRR
jgi:DNA-nicking Smr family endonuclease